MSDAFWHWWMFKVDFLRVFCRCRDPFWKHSLVVFHDTGCHCLDLTVLPQPLGIQLLSLPSLHKRLLGRFWNGSLSSFSSTSAPQKTSLGLSTQLSLSHQWCTCSPPLSTLLLWKDHQRLIFLTSPGRWDSHYTFSKTLFLLSNFSFGFLDFNPLISFMLILA